MFQYILNGRLLRTTTVKNRKGFFFFVEQNDVSHLFSPDRNSRLPLSMYGGDARRLTTVIEVEELEELEELEMMEHQASPPTLSTTDELT